MANPATSDDYANLGLITPFDEGPTVYIRISNATNTGSVDTSGMDRFRQGVSLTMPQHYWNSTVTVHSGEENHKLPISEYGIKKNMLLRSERFFQEIDYFNPTWFISCQDQITASGDLPTVLSYPIITSDSDQAENYIFNGVIEPLSIRGIMTFFSIDVPYEAHDVRGSFGSGNENHDFGTSQVTNIREMKQGFANVTYLDVVDTYMSRPTNGYYIYEQNPISPFDDVSFQPGVRYPLSASQEMRDALMRCSPDTESYLNVNGKELSMNSGFTYGNCNELGTDSLAFGGMIYCVKNQLSSTIIPDA